MRRFGSTMLIASSISLALGVAAAPVDAGTFQTLSLSSSSTHVKTSTGKTVDVEVFAFKLTGDNSTSVSVTLRSGTFTRGESHTWSFRVGGDAFTYNNGQGTLNTGNLPLHFGSLDLTFAKSSQSTSNCPDSGTSTTVRGSLQGALDFDSKSDSWGKVHDNTFGFDTPNFLTMNDSCTGEGNVKVVCSKNIHWTSPYQQDAATANGFTVFTGDTSKTTITGSRLVYLDNTFSTYRSDVVSDIGRAPVVDGSKLTIRTKKGTRVRGSATISGGTSDKHSTTCHKSGKTFHEHTASHTGGNWSSANGIKFNETAFADFKTVLKGQSPGWYKETYS